MMVVVMVMVSFAAPLPCISAGISLQCTRGAAAGVIIRRSSKCHVTSTVNLLFHALKNYTLKIIT